jgi:hypothetical protein
MVSGDTIAQVPRSNRHCSRRATGDLPEAELPRITTRALIFEELLPTCVGFGMVAGLTSNQQSWWPGGRTR